MVCPGTVGAKNYGVAKKAILHSVRVLSNSGSGTVSAINKGLDYVKGVKLSDPARKMVINLSAGTSSVSSSMNKAIDSTVEAGVIVVVAAGNDAANACKVSPASAKLAIVVAATDMTDRQASFSNFGTCVDIYAPGVAITSLSNLESNKARASGTSMASPHVAGAMALYLEAGRTAQDLLDFASLGLVQGAGVGSLNKLLYVPPSLEMSAKTIHQNSNISELTGCIHVTS
jgi:subtilisin family serine protease